MHYSSSVQEFERLKEKLLWAWSQLPGLRSFSKYLKKEWLDSRYYSWQCLLSPIGFAKTNNPVEQFNKLIKRDYTLRVRIKTCSMLRKLLLMCHHKSVTASALQMSTKPSSVLLVRAKKLIKDNRLVVTQARHDVLFILGEFEAVAETLLVRSVWTDEDTSTDVADGARNNRQMERLDQPNCGWLVDLQAQRCPCKSYYKYGYCVHLIAALRHKDMPIPGWKGSEKRFVNRRVRRKEGVSTVGRESIVGHALSIE